jgi:hypothetical protein
MTLVVTKAINVGNAPTKNRKKRQILAFLSKTTVKYGIKTGANLIE